MKPIAVYRIDHAKKTRVKIGTVIERRRGNREGNLRGLLFLARKSFASSPEEASLIAVDCEENDSGRTGGNILPPP